MCWNLETDLVVDWKGAQCEVIQFLVFSIANKSYFFCTSNYVWCRLHPKLHLLGYCIDFVKVKPSLSSYQDICGSVFYLSLVENFFLKKTFQV